MAENEAKTDRRVKYLVESKEYGTLSFYYPPDTTDEEIAKKQYVTVDEARKHIVRPEMPEDVKRGIKAEVLEPYPFGQPENIRGPAVIRYVRSAPSYYESKKLGAPQTVYGMTDKEYDALIKGALKKLTDREPFSYDPEKDADFAAYRGQLRDAAESAYRRILNENNTSVFGASGAVLSEAAAAKNAELNRIPDLSREFYDRAYERYTGETKRLQSELEDISSLASAAYKRMREADKDQYDRARQAQQELYAEEQRRFENELSLRDEERRDRKEALDAALRGLEMEGQQSKNRSARAQADMDETYASAYDEYLTVRLAGMALDNLLKQRELELKMSDYDRGYQRKRGELDAKLGVYRGY